MATEKTVLDVRGMHCEHCVMRVERALKKVEGVSTVAVDLAGGKAAVEFTPEKANLEALKAAVRAIGFEVA